MAAALNTQNKMRFLFILIISLSASADKLISTELILPRKYVAPGQLRQVIIKANLKKGWHTYWKNPGESGLAPEFSFSGTHYELKKVHLPTPKYYKKSGIINYVYDEEILFIADVLIKKSAPKGELKLQGSADFLVCKDSCIPQSTNFSATIKVDPANQIETMQIHPLLSKAMDLMPRKLNKIQKSQKGSSFEIVLPKQFQNNQEIFFAFEDDGAIAKSHKIKNGKLRFLAEDVESFSGLLINGKHGLIIE